MPQCQATKKNGEQCNGNAKQGEKWCHYHKKRYAKMVKHGNTASPELLGVPQNQSLTFKQFYEQENPLELQREIALLRTMYLELRAALERNQGDSRGEMIEDYKARMEGFLADCGLSDEVIQDRVAELGEDLDDLLLEYIGPAEPITAEDIVMLRDHIEAVSRVAEKAKKIKDGFTLNVDLGNVHNILVQYTQQVVLPNIKDRFLRSKIVEETRAFQSRGIQKAISGEVL